MTADQWSPLSVLGPRRWTCWGCGAATGNDRGYHHANPGWLIYLCPLCGRPTFFEGDKQVPGVAFGKTVDNLPDDLARLYDEARSCMAAGACTAAVLTCRKILMHAAVAQGAAEGQNFAFYVGHLVDGSILPARFRPWVDSIRRRSNEANHEIVLAESKDAEDLLSFTEMLLKLLYEYPHRASSAAP